MAIRLPSPLRQTPHDEEEENDSATYYSPNVALDESRYRYDLGEDEEMMTQEPSLNEYSFFDEAVIFVRAGSGGQGSSTYKKEWQVKMAFRTEGMVARVEMLSWSWTIRSIHWQD
jgi:hypothetical protein